MRKIQENHLIPVHSLNEIATEKIVALQDRARNEARDLYDLWYLIAHEVLCRTAYRSNYKIRFRKKEPTGVEERILAKEAHLKLLWNGRLGHQMEALPQYEEVFRTVRRILRQAGFAK